MSIITGDERADFVIERYSEIVALQEVFDYADNYISEWVKRHIRDTIYSLRQSFFADLKLEISYNDKDDSTIRWFDKELYKPKSQKGIFFETELDYDLDSLNPKTEHEGGWVYIQANKMPQRYIINLRNYLNLKLDILNPEKIIVDPDDGENIICACYLYDSINLDIIKNGQFPHLLLNSIKTFTEVMVKIVRDYKDK